MTDYPSWLDTVITWGEVDPADYESAQNYLSIEFGDVRAESLVTSLRSAPVVKRRANDVLRAVQREALPMSDPGVAGELRKVLTGGKLTPVFIAGDDIADGYHRVSLVCNLDPFATVSVQIG